MGPKILFSSALIAAGTALAVGGPALFVGVASFVWRYLYLVLFGIAGLMVVAAMVPRRALAAPATLALLGLAVLLTRTYGVGPVARFGGGASLTVLGIMLAMRADQERDVNLDRRRWAVLYNRSLRPSRAPARIRLVAAGGRRMTVDLATAANQNTLIQLFLSTWYGQIDLRFPTNWVVVAGRVTATRKVNFGGTLDWSLGFEDPDGTKEAKKLQELRAPTSSSAGRRACVAVVHVLGVGGSVTVERGKR